MDLSVLLGPLNITVVKIILGFAPQGQFVNFPKVRLTAQSLSLTGDLFAPLLHVCEVDPVF